MPKDSVIITDSRGFRLQESILSANVNNIPVGITVQKHNGAGLRRLAQEAIDYSRNFPDHIVYVSGGICDFTIKNRVTGEITFDYKSQLDLTASIVKLLDEIDYLMHSNRPYCKFVICPLVGVDVSRYIPFIAATTPNLQNIFTGSTLDVNDHILHINQDRGYRMPYLATRVHTWRNHHYHHYYERLASDGIHLTDDIRHHWASALIKAIEMN